MDLVTYADLAVRLVNSAAPGGDDRDGLASVEAYRTLVAPTGPIFGSVADRHAAGAAAGLAGLVTEGGAGCLGTCAGGGCGRVFIGNGPLHGKRYCSEACTSGANVHAFRASGRRGGGQRPAATAAG